MAQVNLTIPDAILPDLRAAHGVTTNAQLKQHIIDQLRARHRDYKATQAAEAARTAAATSADTDTGGIS